MRPTKKNLKEHAAQPLAQWLIHAARCRSSITYGEAKLRLEREIGFSTIFSPTMGVPAGNLMDRMLDVRPGCPPLNVLLVRQEDRMPGEGAGPFMADYLSDRRLASTGFRDRHPRRWRSACDEIATDVYAFDDWNELYRDAFGERLPAPTQPQGTENDGIRHARRGEGPNHKALRLWVRDHPGKIRGGYANFATDTEVVLDSADRVDVVYYDPDSTVRYRGQVERLRRHGPQARHLSVHQVPRGHGGDGYPPRRASRHRAGNSEAIAERPQTPPSAAWHRAFQGAGPVAHGPLPALPPRPTTHAALLLPMTDISNRELHPVQQGCRTGSRDS